MLKINIKIHRCISISILILSALFMVLPTVASAEVKYINPIEDTYIDSSNPDDNFVGSARISVSSTIGIIPNDTQIALFKYDLSGIPDNIKINSILFRLYAYAIVDTTSHMAIYRYSNNDWNPNNVTWNNLPQGDYEYISEKLISYEDTYYTWNITGAIKADDIKDNDIITLVAKSTRNQSGSEGVSFKSINYFNESLWPLLFIDYSVLNEISQTNDTGNMTTNVTSTNGKTNIIPNSLEYEIKNIEMRGQVAEGDGPQTWDGRSFSGFYYGLDDNIAPEMMNITTNISGRNISEGTLVYTTYKIPKTFKSIENGHTFPYGDGIYHIVSLSGQPYVAVNGKVNKLSKLVVEQDNEDNKTLTIGENWNISNDWNLTIQDIDAGAQQALFVLSRNGNILEEKLVSVGDTYVYKEKNISGETDVPMFVSYIDDISMINNSSMVRLKYTWAVLTSVAEIVTGDKYGNLIVIGVNADYIQFANNGAINLSAGSKIDIMGNLKFKVADSDVLRYYPLIEHHISTGMSDIFASKNICSDISCQAKSVYVYVKGGNQNMTVYPFLLNSSEEIVRYDNISVPIRLSIYTYISNETERIKDRSIYGGSANISRWNSGIKIPYASINTTGWDKEDAMLYATATLPDGKKIAGVNSSVRIVPVVTPAPTT